MALNLQVSARTPITVPLTADPALVEANPPRCINNPPCGDIASCRHIESPIARFIVTGSTEGLVIPDGVSTATFHTLTPDEVRDAGAAAGRYVFADEAVYDRVQAAGATREVIDALSEADHAAFMRRSVFERRLKREACRRGLIALSDAPQWKPDKKDGFPVELLAICDSDDRPQVGERIIDEVGAFILSASSLGKAWPLSSASSSGVRAPSLESASTTTAPVEPPAMDGSPPAQEQPSAAVS